MKLSYKDLNTIRDDNPDKTIIFLGGTFDLFHIGHLTYLREAKKLGDILVVGINSDTRTKRVKGPDRPVIKQNHRAEIVGGLKEVDYTFVMPKKAQKDLRPSFQVIRKLKPDFFVVTEKSWFESASFYEQYGTELRLLPRINKTSTTRILKRIKSKVTD